MISFKNNGFSFSLEDWNRLKSISVGNTNEKKVYIIIHTCYMYIHIYYTILYYIILYYIILYYIILYYIILYMIQFYFRSVPLVLDFIPCFQFVMTLCILLLLKKKFFFYLE